MGQMKVLRMVNINLLINFVSLYYIKSETLGNKNDCEPVIADNELIELSYAECKYLKLIPLMPSKEKSKCRDLKAVLRYHEPSIQKSLEQYAHHLHAFYPFRNEGHLTSPPLLGFYYEKLQEPGVMKIVSRKKSIIMIALKF